MIIDGIFYSWPEVADLLLVALVAIALIFQLIRHWREKKRKEAVRAELYSTFLEDGSFFRELLKMSRHEIQLSCERENSKKERE